MRELNYVPLHVETFEKGGDSTDLRRIRGKETGRRKKKKIEIEEKSANIFPGLGFRTKRLFKIWASMFGPLIKYVFFFPTFPITHSLFLFFNKYN